MHTETPTYLSRLPNRYCPSRVLRLFSSNLLQVPLANLIFSSRYIHAAAPTIWNFLPDSVRSSDTFNCFRNHLKTLCVVGVGRGQSERWQSERRLIQARKVGRNSK